MKMKAKTFIAIATLLAIGQGAWAQTTSFTVTAGVEEGTEEKPFLIENIADLNALASDVNSGTDYREVYFKLTTNLDYSDVSLFDSDEDGNADSNFTPIGYGDETEGNSFKGIFDGNNKYIKGITVNTPSAVGVALFGYIYHPAEIRNLTLKNCSFTGNYEVGAIAGASYGSATNSKFGIYDCTVESTVNVTAVKNGYGKVNWSFAGDSEYATGAESDTNTADSETESYDVIVSKEAPENMEFTVTASFGEGESKLTCSSKIKVVDGDPSIMQYENNIMNTPCDAAIEGDMILHSGKGTGSHAKFVLQNATAAVSFGLQYDQGASGGYGGKTAFLVENITQSSQKYSRYGLGSRDEYWHIMMTYTEATDTIDCYVNGELRASVKNKKFKDANGVCSVLQGSLEGAGRLEGDQVDVEFKNVKLKNCSEYNPKQYFAPSIRKIGNKGITVETYGAPNNNGENRYKIYGKILDLKGKDWDSDPNNVQGVVNFSLFWK